MHNFAIIGLTILAGAWRWSDGRGIGPTWTRNVIGLILALACSTTGILTGPHPNIVGLTIIGPAMGIIAWLSMIAGYTDWPDWRVSVARYSGPTVVISLLASTVAPPIPCLLYGLGGVLVGLQYPLLQRTGWKYATATSEVIAGIVILGGLSWL